MNPESSHVSGDDDTVTVVVGATVVVGVVAVGDVIVIVVTLVVGLGWQLHTELNLDGFDPQAADARVGKPMVTVCMPDVYVAQKAEADDS